MNSNQIVPPILPERVVEMAWGLNLAYSNLPDKSATITPDEIRYNFKEIRRKLQEQITNNEGARNDARKALVGIPTTDSKFKGLTKTLNTAEEELKLQTNHLNYINNIEAALSSCERNLRSIIRGRDQNFEQADSLMKTQIANIESSARLTKDLQSSIPRLFATGGGASGTIVVNYILQSVFHYTVPVEVLAAGAVIVAGAVYGVFEWKVAPGIVERSQREIIKNDYRRNTYFAYYVDRVVAALGALFNQTLNTYQTIYGIPYDSYDQKKIEEAIWNVLGGREGICGKLCAEIHSHYYRDMIDPKNWSSCETGKGCEQCPAHNK